MLKQRVDKYYKHVVSEDLIVLYNYKNIFSLPSFDSAAWSSSSKKFVSDKRSLIDVLSAGFLSLTQRCVEVRAHKDVASYQLRKGVLLGGKTTLRNKQLSTLLDKLLIFVMPSLLTKVINKNVSQNRREQSCLHKLVLALPKATAATTACIDKKDSVLNTFSCTKTSAFIGNSLKKYNNYFANDAVTLQRENKVFKTSQLTIGHTNLLVFPELKKFFPFFESCGGFSLSVFLRIPKINTFVQNKEFASYVGSFSTIAKQGFEKTKGTKTKTMYSIYKEQSSLHWPLEKNRVYEQNRRNCTFPQDDGDLSFFCLPQNLHKIGWANANGKSKIFYETQPLRATSSPLSLPSKTSDKENTIFVLLNKTNSSFRQKQSFADKALPGYNPELHRFCKIVYNFVNGIDKRKEQGSLLKCKPMVYEALSRMNIYSLGYKRRLFLSAFQFPAL